MSWHIFNDVTTLFRKADYMQLLNMQFLQYLWDGTIKIRHVKNCLINKYKTSLAITIEPKHISCYSVILPHWSDPVAVANIHTSTSHYSVMALSMNLAWIFKLKDPEKTKQRNFHFVCKLNKPRSTRHTGTRSIDARGGDLFQVLHVCRTM